jgi:hypothetical protein
MDYKFTPPSAPDVVLPESFEQAYPVAAKTLRGRILTDLYGSEGRDGQEAKIGPFNRFKVEGGKRPWLVKEIHLDLPAEDEAYLEMLDTDADIAAVAILSAEDGNDYPAATAVPAGTAQTHYGRLWRDEDGQVWFHGAEGNLVTAPDEDEWGLRRVYPNVSEVLRAGWPEDPFDHLPIEGELGFAGSGLITQIMRSSVKDLSDAAFEKMKAGLSDGGAEIAESWRAERDASFRLATEKVAREQAIADIFDSIVDVSKLQFLKEGLEFPIDKEALSEHRRKTVYHTRSPIDDLSEELMEAFREAGYTKKCPNNGPRCVREMTQWDAWLSGKELSVYDKMSLSRAPGFDMLEKAMTSASVQIEMAIEKSLSPDGKISYDDRPKFDLSEEDVDREIALTVEKAREAFIAETPDLTFTKDSYDCQVTGKRVRIGGTVFEPVLTQFTKDYKEVVAPVVEAPKPALHFEIPMPTGELVMADWLRMKGFKDGLLARVGGDKDDFYDINNATGLDERMQDYLTKGGLAIVQVGNSSPSAYDDTQGVWRMGHVDEDHFYTEDGVRKDIEMPNEAWTTCTDLWANIFADRAVIIDILMASGEYESRETADVALLEYVEDSYGASINKLDVDRLHVYAPTGFGFHTGSFKKQFRAEELDYAKWRKDSYVLSVEPLTVDPDVVIETGWEAPAHEISEAPEPC